MTKQQFYSALNTKNYEQMLIVYKEFRKETKFDKFFDDAKENPQALHINMLHAKVSSIFRILEQNKYFEQAVNLLPPIVVRPTPMKPVMPKNGKKEDPGNNSKPRFVDMTHVDVNILPADLKEKWYESSRMNGEMKSLHAKMSASEDKTVRTECRSKLDEYELKIRDIWTAINNWCNEPLIDAQPKDASALELAKKISAAQKYVQRNRFTYEAKTLTEAQLIKYDENCKFLDENGVKYNCNKKRGE